MKLFRIDLNQLLFQNYYCCFKSSKQVNLLYRLYFSIKGKKITVNLLFLLNDSSGNFIFLDAAEFAQLYH